MARTPQHSYQILSKRPRRLSRLLLSDRFAGDVHALTWQMDGHMARPRHWPLPNVWMGTSIEMDRYCPRADSLRETPAAVRFLSLEPLLGPLPSLDLTGIDWAIIGGESGGGAREMDLGWARDLVTRCREAGTAVFVKQLGSCWARRNGGHGKGGDWDRWPEDLRIREFPRTDGTVAA
jgi:protein gp37